MSMILDKSLISKIRRLINCHHHTRVYTDEFLAYENLKKYGFVHKQVCHSQKEYARGDVYTFYDGGEICHVSVADPFCNDLRNIAMQSARKLRNIVHPKATYVCIEGPRFSTRAESRLFREALGGDIIGMTLVPECVLAREAEICYVSISSITDYDVWSESPVNSKDILEQLKRNVESTRNLITEMIPLIPNERTRCTCGRALAESLL